MPVPPNHDDLDMYFQCRIIGCRARCAVSPKQSGRLGDHWREKHVQEHGPFNGRDVLVMTRNPHGTFAHQNFGDYADANGISYKTQTTPRPSRHTTSAAPTLSSTARPRALPTIPALISRTASIPPNTNPRRVELMKRQIDMVNDRILRQASLSLDPDTIDSHPNRPFAPLQSLQRTPSTRVPLKRNLSMAFSDARSSPAQGISSPNHKFRDTSSELAKTSYGFRSAPIPRATKLPFSQALIEHLRPFSSSISTYDIKPPPLPTTTPRLALTASQSLRGTLDPFPLRGTLDLLPPPKNPTIPQDYAHATWTCEPCKKDFANMASVTRHLRDIHFVAGDVVWCTPDRDVITVVMASVRQGQGWVDGSGRAVEDEEDSGDSRGDDRRTVRRPPWVTKDE